MSEIFHKSCYTSRSSGYKYRTLSTNTGEKKHRDSLEDNLFDRKLRELKREMTSRIVEEVDHMAEARETIIDKYNKIDSKISLMIELQDAITGLRKNLSQAECSLAELVEKVEKIEAASNTSEANSLQSKKNSFRLQPPISEEVEIFSSTINHIKTLY